MAELEDDMSRLQRWWSENGVAITLGAIIGLALIIGWQGWRWYQANQNEAAAALYSELEPQFAQGTITASMRDTVERLKQDYAGTPYPADAALRLAGLHVAEQAYADAREQLEWAMEYASHEGIAHIARVRAARVVWTQDEPEQALSLLAVDHPPAFESLYAELEGDIQRAMGDRAAARDAYQRALDGLPDDVPSQSLQDKIADSAPDPTTDAATSSNG